jgi:hypothetical protein
LASKYKPIVINKGQENKFSNSLKRGAKVSIIYCASYSPPKSDHLRSAFNGNVATLLKYLSRIKIKVDSFIYFSTSKLNEENILEPDKHISNKYYYLSKLFAEYVLFDKSYLFNKLLILRCPTIFGKEKKKSNLTNLVSSYINNQPVIIPRDQKLFNACTSVTDLFLICQKTINRSDSWAKIFEIGASNKISIYSLLEKINKKNLTNIRVSNTLKTAKLLEVKKISSFLKVGLSPLDKIIRCKI